MASPQPHNPFNGRSLSAAAAAAADTYPTTMLWSGTAANVVVVVIGLGEGRRYLVLLLLLLVVGCLVSVEWRRRDWRVDGGGRVACLFDGGLGVGCARWDCWDVFGGLVELGLVEVDVYFGIVVLLIWFDYWETLVVINGPSQVFTLLSPSRLILRRAWISNDLGGLELESL